MPDSVPIISGSNHLDYIVFDLSLSFGASVSGVCRDSASMFESIEYARNLVDSMEFAIQDDKELIIREVKIDSNTISFFTGTLTNFIINFNGEIYQDSLKLTCINKQSQVPHLDFNTNRVYYFYLFSQIYSKDWKYTFKGRKNDDYDWDGLMKFLNGE